jgi:glycosyltransferase involved in cell wall biosynthesis
MKVLIINTSWTGDSTGKIAYGMHRALKAHGHESCLVYGYQDVACPDDDVVSIDTMLDIRLQWAHNQLTGLHGAFSPRAMKRLEGVIDGFKPDLVQLYNLHGYYIDMFSLFCMLKKRNIPIVYGMLDESAYLGYCCYAYDCDGFRSGCGSCRRGRFRHEYPRSLFLNGAHRMAGLKAKAYGDYDRLVFTGPEWVLLRAGQSWIMKNARLYLLDEYIDTDETFVPRDGDELRRQLGIGDDEVVLLDVGRSSDKRKGVHYFIELAKRMEVYGRRFRFINIGFSGDEQELPDNFIPVPFMKSQTLLAQYYSMADMFVCTSMADTMPNTCLDSLSCGTPVCGFDITGVPYVASEPLGYFFEPGNVDELEAFVSGLTRKTEQMAISCREYALKRYSPKVYYDRLEKLYFELIGTGENS